METQKITKKEIAREISKDAGDTAKKGLKCLGKIAIKASYPILGNLSDHVQKRFEDTLGYKVYNAQMAYELSKKINKVVYPIAGAVLGAYLSTKVPIEAEFFQEHPVFKPEAAKDIFDTLSFFFGGLVGGLYGLGEAYLRDEVGREKYVGYSASLLGKFVSSPFDVGCWAYEKAVNLQYKKKNYFQKIKNRIESKKSLENKVEDK